MSGKLTELIHSKGFNLVFSPVDVAKPTSNSSVIITVPANILSITDVNQDAVASALVKNKFFDGVEENKQRDLLYVAWKYVHVGGNKNKDFFTSEALRGAEKTPIYKPLNWLHGEPNIGVIYDSMYVSGGENEPDYLAVYSAIWKFKYKVFAEEILSRNLRNELYVSMETWFTEITCTECGQHFAAADEVTGNVCPHLMNRMQEGSNVYRILGNICFGGGGVVDDPADELASRLAVASKEKDVKEGNNTMDQSEKKYTQEELDAKITEAVASALEKFKQDSDEAKSIAEKDEKIKGLETDLEKALALTSTLTAERDSARKEFDDYKIAEAEKVKLQSRVDQLVAKGFKFPDETEKEKRETVLNTIAIMSDEVFAMFIDNIKSNDDSQSKGSNNLAQASVRIPSGATGSDNKYPWKEKIEELLNKLP
jgi:hypothetical protein